MCCMRLAEIQNAKNCKKSPSGHHRTTKFCQSSRCTLQLRHMYRQSKKIVKLQYILHMSHNMVNFGPLAAEIGLPNWGTPANFNGFRLLASLLHRRRSPEANQTLQLCTMFGRLLGWYTVYTFFEALLP